VSLIDLSGRVVLVTGGSRGIGAATARMLAQAGAAVAITYRERADDADAVIKELRGNGKGERDRERGKGKGEKGKGKSRTVSPIAIQGDVSRKEDCERIVAETVSAFGRLDIFVANAGVWHSEEVALTEMSDEQWRRTMAVNLDSVFYGCRAALKVMAKRGERGAGSGTSGRIVIVSSTAAQRGESYHADYAASKGAVNSFVKSLAVEAAPRVNVNAVAPGWVDTEMCDIPFGREAGSGRRAIEAGIPLGRVASAEDIAGPIVFLCSEMARHVTGEILNVNGGSVLCG
jgi:3-oxoacyl-[acyl-carrier protein] reductase